MAEARAPHAPRSVPRWGRRAMLCAFAAALSFFACGGDPEVKHSQSRLLDDACTVGSCPLTGSARRTSGITPDSSGFQLGPGSGSVTIPIALPSGYDNQLIEVLVAGTGNARVGASLIQLSPSPRWVPVDRSTQPSSSGTPEAVSVGVDTDGSVLSLYDVRATSFQYINCD